jgi:predicted glycosyltransferase
MIKKTNEEYQPLSIKINPQHALDIRKNIIKITAKTFQPNLFIVDKEPLGLKKEILPALRWLRRSLPGTKTILGLRDIMDDASIIRKDWEENGVYQVMEELYNEIWVYGIREFYDPIREYSIPESISRKITFTGYIARKVPGKAAAGRIKEKYVHTDGKKLVVVTTGGGGDGYAMMDRFLSMLESENRPLPFKSVLITGPFMPRKQSDEIITRAKKLGLRTWRFYRGMEEILAAADLVVSMGGYNTVCEVLTQRTVSLIIPRDTPRREQLIRAQVLHGRNMVDYIPWNSFSSQILRDKLLGLLERPEPYKGAMSRFRLTGLDVMSQRLQAFKNKES